jgi:hypothetical protein
MLSSFSDLGVLPFVRDLRLDHHVPSFAMDRLQVQRRKYVYGSLLLQGAINELFLLRKFYFLSDAFPYVKTSLIRTSAQRNPHTHRAVDNANQSLHPREPNASSKVDEYRDET